MRFPRNSSQLIARPPINRKYLFAFAIVGAVFALFLFDRFCVPPPNRSEATLFLLLIVLIFLEAIFGHRRRAKSKT